MPIVDAHPHIYSPDHDAYPTIEEPWEPGEPASAEDLKKMMDVTGVDRAVFIQTSTFYGHDNRYIMDSAKEHSDWACGVLTLDPDDQSHVDLLEDAVANSNIRGMRGTTDSLNRIATPNVYRLWTKAMELGIPVNCMVMDDLERVPEIERIAQDLGDLKIVIDHCFMLNTRHRTEETLDALERLAKLPNVYAKLTPGTHGSYRVYPFVDMHDPLKRVIAAFEPNRCVWGSNFPNALWSKGASYAQNLHLFVKELGLSLPDKADILGVTAMSLWFPREHEDEERLVNDQQKRTERESIQAQEDSEELVPEDDQSAQAIGHTAEITQMADLIAAQGVVEGPILDEVDGVELTAILDAANDLNAVLDTIEVPEKSAEIEPEADVEVPQKDSPMEAEPVVSEDVADDSADTSVNVEELLAAQNYTPIKTDEIGEVEEADSDIASDVQYQLEAALGSVDDISDVEIAGIELTDREARTDEEPPTNIEELLAAQVMMTPDEPEEPALNIEEVLATEESVGNIETDEAEEPAQVSEDDIAADVQAQLDSALGSFSESPEIEIEDNESNEEESEGPTIDVAKLLAEQNYTPDKANEIVEPEVDEPSTSGSGSKVDPEFDMSTIMEAADELNAALESMNKASEQDEPPAASHADESPESTADPEDVVVNVDELLPAQNTAPVDTEEAGEPEPPTEVGADSDDEEMDLSGLMDVANQLNSMLESVDDIAANINELAEDAEDVDDQSERTSA